MPWLPGGLMASASPTLPLASVSFLVKLSILTIQVYPVFNLLGNSALTPWRPVRPSTVTKQHLGCCSLQGSGQHFQKGPETESVLAVWSRLSSAVPAQKLQVKGPLPGQLDSVFSFSSRSRWWQDLGHRLQFIYPCSTSYFPGTWDGTKKIKEQRPRGRTWWSFGSGVIGRATLRTRAPVYVCELRSFTSLVLSFYTPQNKGKKVTFHEHSPSEVLTVNFTCH